MWRLLLTFAETFKGSTLTACARQSVKGSISGREGRSDIDSWARSDVADDREMDGLIDEQDGLPPYAFAGLVPIPESEGDQSRHDNYFDLLRGREVSDAEDVYGRTEERATAIGDDEDVCRVCRSGTEEGPLSYPCSCSGSVRFVHEACLAEWLARSKKTKCELCGSPFRYTKIFRPDMPTNLPPLMLARHSLSIFLTLLLLGLRAVFVAFAWLAALPWTTIWVFRFYLTAADTIGNLVLLMRKGSQIAASNVVGQGVSLAPKMQNAVLRYETCPLPPIAPWRRILSKCAKDTFAGQILTSIVVVLFVLCFLLREWVGMHGFGPQNGDNPNPNPIPVPVPANDEAAPPLVPLPHNADAGAPQEVIDVFRRLEERRAGAPLTAEEYAAFARTLGLVEPAQARAQRLDGAGDAEDVEYGDYDDEDEGRHDEEEDEYEEDDVWEDESEGAVEEREMRELTARLIAPLPRRAAELPAELPGEDAGEEHEPPVLMRPPFWQNPPPLEFLAPGAMPAVPGAAAGGGGGWGVALDELEDEGGEPWGDDAFDDFEGVLEAVGMTGSLLVLVQNMGLMNLLIALCLGATVWVPLVLGRILAAGNAISLITRPLLLVRSLSDPVFDFLFSPLVRFLPLVTKTSAAPVGASTRPLLFTLVRDHWNLMATSPLPLHRGLCVALGYATVLGCGLGYVRGTRNAYRESFDRAVRDVVVQQMLFVKIALFVFVEIIIFPATCGAVLNAATVLAFPESTIYTRLAFFSKAPFSSFFLTWLAGTAFMFTFSMAIDTIRDSLRKGVMWFIRDPTSADIHPIKEILEKDSSTQARKIAVSAMLYAGVILATFGINILFMRYACFGVLPLRWKYERAFSFPLDLVLFRFALPLAIQFTNPTTKILALFLSWARKTAHVLRLTSFLFGERDSSEEGTHVRRTWRARLMLRKADPSIPDEGDRPTHVTPRDVVFRKDGEFARVPAVDNIRVAPGRRMLVRVTEQGVPIDEAGAEIIKQQVIEMTTTRQTDKYQVVYLPPWFRTRVALFVYLLWLTGSLTAVAAIIGPLMMGRQILDSILTTEAHDVYSFALGFTIIGTATAILQRRPSLPSLNAVLVSIQSSILIGVLLPLLSSFSVSALFILPFSRAPSTPSLLEVNIPQSWATGTMILSAAWHLARTPFFARTHPYRLLVETTTQKWRDGEKIQALQQLNSQLVTKATAGLIVLLGLPGLLVLIWPFGKPDGFHARCKLVFGSVASCLLAAGLAKKCSGVVSRWMVKLREDEFLLEKKLQNYDGQEAAGSRRDTSHGADVWAADGLPGLEPLD